MNRLLSSIFLLLLSVSTLFAVDLPVGDSGDGNAIVSTSQKKLNMRSGPGTEYGVVAQLAPGETAWVTDIASVESGWVQIHTGSYKGYVSTSYIRSANGNDYTEWIANYSGEKKGKDKSWSKWMPDISKWMPDMSSFRSIFTDLFMALLGLPFLIIAAGCAVALILEILIILLLKRMYSSYRSPALLYVVVFVSFLINLAVLAMYPASETGGRYASIVWFMLLISVFPLLIHSCWRLEQNGKVENKYYRNNTKCGYIGKYLGILAWLIMLIPILYTVKAMVGRLLFDLIPIPDHFWPLIGTLCGLIITDGIFVFLWYLILRNVLLIVSNIVAYILSFEFIYLVVLMEGEIINVFNGFYYVIAFCGMIILGLMSGYVAYRIIREYRCSNCHHFSGSVSGRTDYGYSVSSSDRWVGISGSSIKSSGKVSDAQELRRTHETWHSTTDHIRCEYCGNSWDIDNDNLVHTEQEAIARKWTETK